MLVFLVLAAQYESWSLPLAVILVVPMCLLCSTVGVNIARMDINIFTQVGFIVLVGLACKNAILIVEFAKAQRESGSTRENATLEACQLRLRPIMMTSLAFILGVVPLVLSQGAGAEMRKTLGTAVFSGMLGVTLFGIFLTPVFYFVIQWVSDTREPQSRISRRIRSDGSDDGTPATGPAVIAEVLRDHGDHAQAHGQRRRSRHAHMSPTDHSDKLAASDRRERGTQPASPTLNVVLVEPEIALNTGSIGRTCVAAGAMLWLVRPLGFHLDDRHVRRAGLDYWEHLHWQVVDRLDDVVAALGARPPVVVQHQGDPRLHRCALLARRRAGLWSGEPRSSRALVKGMWGTSPADPDASGGPELESRERRGRRCV